MVLDRLRRVLRRALPLGILLAATVLIGRAPLGEAEQPTADHSGHAAHMAGMQDWVRDWYESHPRAGTPSAGAPADTFVANGLSFDNGNPSTAIDTARIWVGQTILWRVPQLGGSHTATNGTGHLDPNVGTLFDQPIDPTHSFAFEFTSSGTVPFFCRPHESFNMKGVVIVRAVSDVEPITEGAELSGFYGDPAPNPAPSTVSFRFALQKPGLVRLDVYDARGRLIAQPLNRELARGTYAGAWDRTTRSGERAAAGVYYLRLQVPGSKDSRQVVVTR